MSKSRRLKELEEAKTPTSTTSSTSSPNPIGAKIKEALTGAKDSEKLRKEAEQYAKKAKQYAEKAKELRDEAKQCADEAKQCAEKAKKLDEEAAALEKKRKEALEENQEKMPLFFTHNDDGTIDFDCAFSSEEGAKEFDDHPVSRRCIVVDGHYVRPLTKQEASDYHSL